MSPPTGFMLLDHPNAYKQFRIPRRDDAEPSGLIGVHTAENYPDLTTPDLGAERVARWLLERGDPGSYHTLVDSDTTVPLAPPEAEVWSDRFLNRWQVSLSMATRAADWPALTPGYRDGMIRRAAAVGAGFVRWYAERGISVPVRRLTGAEARARIPGFYAHGDSDPARRSDPGVMFPWSLFLALVREDLGQVTPPVVEPGRSFLPLTVDGVFAHRAITELQRALRKALIYAGMIEEDYGRAAVFGPLCAGSLQQWLRRRGFYEGRPIDGRFHFYSIVALQQWLASVGLYPADAVDGAWGPVTTKGLQRALNDRRIQ